MLIYHISIVQERKRGELNQPSKELQTLNNTTRYARNGTTLYSCSFLLGKKNNNDNNNNDNNNIANSTEYKDMIKNYISPINICEPYPVKAKPSLTIWVLSNEQGIWKSYWTEVGLHT